MYEYQLAVTFWSAVVLVALVTPFLVAFVTRAVEVFTAHVDSLVHGDHAVASIPSNPRPSSPF
jgi:hypothetical protein